MSLPEEANGTNQKRQSRIVFFVPSYFLTDQAATICTNVHKKSKSCTFSYSSIRGAQAVLFTQNFRYLDTLKRCGIIRISANKGQNLGVHAQVDRPGVSSVLSRRRSNGQELGRGAVLDPADQRVQDLTVGIEPRSAAAVADAGGEEEAVVILDVRVPGHDAVVVVDRAVVGDQAVVRWVPCQVMTFVPRALRSVRSTLLVPMADVYWSTAMRFSRSKRSCERPAVASFHVELPFTKAPYQSSAAEKGV